MTRLTVAALLGLALAAGWVAVADASVTLQAIEQTGTPTLAPVLKRVTPAIVSIAVRGRALAEAAGSQKRGARRAEALHNKRTQGAGSGVVFDAHQGLILTNSHVIDKAEEILVTLDDGREFPASFVGSDPDTDVAVIRIAPINLTAITFGNSDQIEVGDFVLAIGNPFQIGRTVTSGIVSGLHRNNVGIEQYEDFIQTDAAIYPGNSGGALVNLRGDLIGISTAFIGGTNTNPGMGFAIPINMARAVADHLLEFGDARHGRLGISYEDPIQSLEHEYNLATPPTAPVITKLDAGSAAERAGLKVGDVVTELGGAAVRDTADLRTRLGLMWSGDIAQLTVERDGTPVTIRATLADPHPEPRPERRTKTK
jgi:S1-C subfamily serine protease